MFLLSFQLYEILLCGKIISHGTIYILIKSDIIQDYFKDFVYCFRAKKKEMSVPGGAKCPWQVCKTCVVLVFGFRETSKIIFIIRYLCFVVKRTQSLSVIEVCQWVFLYWI